MATPTLTPPGSLTLTVLGCGTMGVAILSGILDSLALLRSGSNSPNGPLFPELGSSPPLPARLPNRFIACVKRRESADRVREAFSTRGAVQVLQNSNVEGVQQADVVLLGCKPQVCEEILTQPGMREALEGKLLVSILAGVKMERLAELCSPSTRVVRAMPNTASKIREGMTVISLSDSLPAEEKALVQWIFGQIGKALILPEKHMDACTALCGSGPAFYALIVEAMADGGVMMGLPRAEAQMMAAQTMQGAGRMVLAGQHPAIIREQVSTPAGCTIGGLLVLEDGKVRSTIARGIQEAANLAAGLGGGKK
ncbi:pyrroline-5-carboxylate reductase dimerization-domain-containing protein [Kalaharituber pfeilii]|nr:pyrroline-5-carboxylate reductase dimerization-domain-containing protein [Kalaharituber pfeilii]